MNRSSSGIVICNDAYRDQNPPSAPEIKEETEERPRQGDVAVVQALAPGVAARVDFRITDPRRGVMGEPDEQFDGNDGDEI